jgi:hypothetical protein
MPTWLAVKGNSRGAEWGMRADNSQGPRMLRRGVRFISESRDGVRGAAAVHMAASFKQPLAEA